MNSKKILNVKFLLALGLILLIPNRSRSSERDLYDFRWLDQDKKVFVLQNKEYTKDNTFYFDFSYLSNLSSTFQDTKGFQAKTGYYFHEEWAFELTFIDYSNKNNDAYNNLRRVNATIPFQRKMDKSYGGTVIYAPFYGKVNTFNKIYYFDWYFGLGVLGIDAVSNAKSSSNPNSEAFSKEHFTGGLAKTGLKFHANKNWHLNLEIQNTYFKGYGPVPGSSKKLNTNTDIMFGIGFSF